MEFNKKKSPKEEKTSEEHEIILMAYVERKWMSELPGQKPKLFHSLEFVPRNQHELT